MIEFLPGGSIFAFDRHVKNKMEETMTVGEEKDLCHGHLKLCLHHNYGSASNFGAGKPIIIKFVSIVLTILISILFILSLSTHGRTSLKVGLSLLLGGAFSNTYDRVKRGYVIDYLRIMHGPSPFKKLIWNIADFAIIIGALLATLSQEKYSE